MLPKGLTQKKPIIVIISIIFVFLVLSGLYLYLANLKVKLPSTGNKSKEAKITSIPIFEEPTVGIAIEEYSKSKAIIVTGKIKGNPYLKDNYYYLDISLDDRNKVVVPVLLGAEKFPVGVRTIARAVDTSGRTGESQVNETKKLGVVLPKLTNSVKVTVWIYYGVNPDDLQERIKLSSCDPDCVEQSNLMINNEETNKTIAENYNNGWKNDYYLGPVILIQVHD